MGVQTDDGAMFIAGISEIQEPPVNDLWTVPGEEDMLPQWQAEDTATFQSVLATTHYHALQIQDFLSVILEDREPLVNGVEGRKTVKIFKAIYRSQQERRLVRFPPTP